MKTLTADAAKRVRIPDAKPRQVFAYERDEAGRVTLTPVEKIAHKSARLVKRGHRTYLMNDQSITNDDVARAMESFP